MTRALAALISLVTPSTSRAAVMTIELEHLRHVEGAHYVAGGGGAKRNWYRPAKAGCIASIAGE